MAESQKKTFELIYSDQHTDYIKGRAYSNPQHFTTARAGVTKVLLVGDWPKVEEAYAAAGVEVEHVSAASVMADPAVTELPAAPAGSDPATRAAVHIPENWRDLKWTGKANAGLTLRSLASVLCDEPVLNKTMAIAAIEGELHRRAQALNASADADMTRDEVVADLEAMGVEFDHGASDDELRAIRNAARAERDA